MNTYPVRLCQQFPSGASAVLVSYPEAGVEQAIEHLRHERTIHPLCSTWIEFNGQRLIHVADIRRAVLWNRD